MFLWYCCLERTMHFQETKFLLITESIPKSMKCSWCDCNYGCNAIARRLKLLYSGDSCRLQFRTMHVIALDNNLWFITYISFIHFVNNNLHSFFKVGIWVIRLRSNNWDCIGFIYFQRNFFICVYIHILVQLGWFKFFTLKRICTSFKVQTILHICGN